MSVIMASNAARGKREVDVNTSAIIKLVNLGLSLPNV